MKIVVVVNSLGSGGAERVATTLANAWANKGMDVRLVATYSGRGTVFYPIDSRVEVVFLADMVKQRSIRLLSFFQRLGKLREIFKNERPAVVVSHLTNVNVMTILARFLLRVPLIICEHNNPLVDGRSRFWRLASRLTYRFANCVSVLTHDVVEPYKELVPGVTNMAVLPNPISDELPATSVSSIETSNRFRLVGVGRLQYQKQFDLLIRMFSSLSGEFANWDLYIWGEGPERSVLESLIDQLGLQQRVFLPGRTTELWKELGRCDLFALPSRYEGWSMALMEAMALGLPTVAFDCPSGPRDLTEGGKSGVLIDNGDAEGFVVALRSMMSKSPAERCSVGRIGADSVRSRFSLPRVVDLWDQQFRNIGVGDQA
ncbi:hypothetical protein A6V36_35770 [Paraburkholderia ginsengiterrae]|uniref:Glycosyl transferase n=1 Tax=Paraburkholderia ginsengiterrae TaxID=1462993 RepID=A0A1A9MZY8_9BURK|nr:glycosyltransferase family 4 protein [Paraburkholderia ginsengiterrae]OAJ53694.1 hypothetical protein A6V37_35275 [Paraburkholderia ginsengiterrae]OAJ54723.1 hypothetical protein A6V36_35770 [Paraburkholderia ginsengiterrae]